MQKRRKIQCLLVAASIIAILAAIFIPKMVSPKEVAYSEFLNRLEANTVESVTIKGDNLTYKIFGSKTMYRTQYTPDVELALKISEHGVSLDVEPEAISADWSTVIYIMSGLLMTTIIISVLTSNRSDNDRRTDKPDKNKRNIIVDKSKDVSFSDVGGNEEAKASLKEIIDFLENPKEYTKMGAQLPKGTLLIGPPGTGKTLMARAVAGEANVPFIYMAGSDFVEMYVGIGAAKVRRMFEIAEKNAPCIVFIDEIDAIGKKRDTSAGGSDEREQTLNQLLSEMDGFNPSKGVVVLAATNRPDVLDAAITRPGRFDRRIFVEKPDFSARKKIISKYINKIVTDDTVDIEQIAFSTAGCTGADLANIVNEAAIKAVRNKRKAVSDEEIQEAMEEILSGSCNHSVVLSEVEKCIIATHEAAHALACIALDSESAINKISIIPRNSNSLGYTLNYKSDERHVVFKDEMMTQIRILLAGYCGEYVLLDNISSSAASDLREATILARNMIETYGMSTEIGPVTFDATCTTPSESMKFYIDKKVIDIIKHCFLETIDFIQSNEEVLQIIASELAQNEVLCDEEIRKLLEGKRIKVPKFTEYEEAKIISQTIIPAPKVIKDNVSEPEAAKPVAAPVKETVTSQESDCGKTDDKKEKEDKTPPRNNPSSKVNNPKIETDAEPKSNKPKKELTPIIIDEEDENEFQSMEIEMDIPDMDVPEDIPESTDNVPDSSSSEEPQEIDLPEPPKKRGRSSTRKTSAEISEKEAQNKKALENILNITNKNARKSISKTAPKKTSTKPKNDDIDDITEDDY